MAFKSFKAGLEAKLGVSFEFVDFSVEEAQRDGSQIIRLILKDTMPVVYGRKMTDRVTGESVTLQANDVAMVVVNPQATAAIEALEKKFEESTGKEGEQPVKWNDDGKSGSVNSKVLKLDVSANGEVWLVSESLAQFGRKRRDEQRQIQKSAIMDRVNALKTKTEFKNVDPTKPESTGNEPVKENQNLTKQGNKPEAVKN